MLPEDILAESQMQKIKENGKSLRVGQYIIYIWNYIQRDKNNADRTVQQFKDKADLCIFQGSEILKLKNSQLLQVCDWERKDVEMENTEESSNVGTKKLQLSCLTE